MHFRRRAQLFITTAMLLGAGMSGIAAGPAGASTTVVPFAASPQANGTIEIFHTCKVIGSAVQGIEAVHCADLFRTQESTSFSSASYTAENEVLCQTTGGTLVECAGIHEQPETALLETTNIHPQLLVLKGSLGVCGVRFGHSACGVRRVINAAPSFQIESLGGSCNVWAVSAGDSVVLPKSGVTVTAPNLATPHAIEPC